MEQTSTWSTNKQTNKNTFVEVLDARIVQRLCHNILQAVFAARAAGVHFHIAEAQLLQVDTKNTEVEAKAVRDHHQGFKADIYQTNWNSLMDTNLTDQGSCSGLPDPRGSREQSSLVS